MNERIRQLLLATGVAVELPSRYKDDLAYFVDGREIAHFEADNVLDLRLTRAVISRHRQMLRDEPGVEVRSGDWITVRIGRPADLALARELIGYAIEANTRR